MNQLVLLRVKSFMNVSGPIIKRVLEIDFKDCQSFKVVCDDLETDFGLVKNSMVGGDRGHNGIKSVMTAFGHNNFEKIKIGIGRPYSKDPEIVSKFVLSKFSKNELEGLEATSFAKIENYFNLKC